MASNIINLRQARKARAKTARRKQADANSVEHGLPKVVRRLERLRKARDDARLDGKKLDS